MDYAIEVENLSYRYPHAEEKSLKNIRLTVSKGRFTAVIGPTGAGKTTLAMCLNGLIPQLMEGDILGKRIVAGRDVSKYRVQTLARHIGLVLQDSEAQIFGRTVEEDTAFGPRNFSFSVEEIEHKVHQALIRVRLEGYNRRNTAELSGGEKQRLALAGVLAIEPEILVLDEPASELDPLGRTEIYDTLDRLRQEKKRTIVVMEHAGEDIIKRADEVIVLNEGEIVWQGSPETLFRNIPLLRRFGIKPLPVSLVGWDFKQKGWISEEEIPLDIEEAEQLVRKIIKRQGFQQIRFNAQQKGFTGNKESQESQELLYPHGSPDSYIFPESPESYGKENRPSLITISNLRYNYHPTQSVLKGISLKIRQGEFVALVGQNGAGKTTLAKHLNGLLKPTSGDVVVDGMNTRDYPTHHLAGTIGYVFQNPDHQIFSMSVEKEIAYGLKNLGLADEEIKERINKVLAYIGLEQHRNRHPFSLTKGERQMIAVASILAIEPKILVIDEPTTGLDWIGVQKIMNVIRKLQEKGTTIIMISHDMDIVAEYAERLIVLKDGGILIEGQVTAVFADSEMLRQAAIVPPQLSRLARKLEDIGLSHFRNGSELAAMIEQGREAECL